MSKSVAQFALKLINEDGVHAIPVLLCVCDSAYETGLAFQRILFSVQWPPAGGQPFCPFIRAR
ncbi:MAG TPA: hypothetical protein DCE30_12285 [Pantoea sp.]|nr:hypothetical protein [Pantoea sp.]